MVSKDMSSDKWQERRTRQRVPSQSSPCLSELIGCIIQEILKTSFVEEAVVAKIDTEDLLG